MNTLRQGVWPIQLPPDRESFHRERPKWEIERSESICNNIVPGEILVDVGTEKGDYAALFAHCGAQVVCIEPEPRYWPEIYRHFEINGLEPYMCFAGFASDLTKEPERPNFDHGNDGLWPKCAARDPEDWHGFRNVIETGDATPQTRIDDLIWSKVSILNIDVEGAELRVLAGCTRILASSRPLVYVSIHPEMMMNDYGIEPKSLFDHMDQFGYRSELLHVDHEQHWLFTPKERE